MIEIKRIAMEPWDFTLYEASDGSLILKVVFSEGDYKIDIGRFYRLEGIDRDADSETLKKVSESIREAFPDVQFEQVEKSQLQIVK